MVMFIQDVDIKNINVLLPFRYMRLTVLTHSCIYNVC